MANNESQEHAPEGDENSEDSDDSEVERSRREDERGRTVLALVGKATQNGAKIPLEWHPIYKIPCGKYKPTFSTYVGVVVRERVSITYSCWKKVPKEILDELYAVITKGFTVRGDRRKYIINQADEKWKAFKTRLRKFWLHHKKSKRVRRSPPWKYPWITKDVWDEFKKICLDENFKKRSEEGRRRSRLKNTSYRGGRLGYQYFEEEIRKEFLEQGVHVDHVPRHETWLRAHSRQKHDGVYKFKNHIDQEVATAINALKAQIERGEIVITSGRDDILAKALKRQEHGGRVRGVGSGTTNREYFGLSTPTSSSDLHAQIKTLQLQQNIMMSFIMSGGMMNQEQMAKMAELHGCGNISSQYVQGSGQFSAQFGVDHSLNRGQLHSTTGHGSSGVRYKGLQGKEYEGGFFTDLLTGKTNVDGQQLDGDSEAFDASYFRTRLEELQRDPYIGPWHESNNMHQDEQQIHPSNCSNVHLLEKQVHFKQPSISQQLDQSSPHTSYYQETDYDTLPLSNQDLPEGSHECCLAIEARKGIQIVATGEVYIPLPTEVVQNHFNRVQIGCRRVSVTKDIVPTALLPCPTKEFTVVCQVVDTFVTWPTYLIFPKKKVVQPNKKLSNSLPRQPPLPTSSSRKYTNEDCAKVTSGLLDALKRIAIEMKVSGETMQLTIPNSVYCKKHDVVLDFEDMLDWCFQKEIGASHMSIFMREMSEMCKEDGISGLYGFIDPDYISALTPTEAEEVRTDYLCHAFGCNGGKNINQLFFAPYHENRHWMLAAVSPWNGTVFWLDPAGRENEIPPFAQQIINEGIKKFSMVYRKDIKKLKKDDVGIKWFKPECPRQPQGSEDCGYYICRYMKETIASRRPLVPNKYFDDIKSYSQEKIDEIRDSWVSYVLKHKEVSYEKQGANDNLEI